MPELDLCDDCRDAFLGVSGLINTELSEAALHIYLGILGGGWACDHVEWTWKDAAHAWEEHAAQHNREREILRQALEDLDTIAVRPERMRRSEVRGLVQRAFDRAKLPRCSLSAAARKRAVA